MGYHHGKRQVRDLYDCMRVRFWTNYRWCSILFLVTIFKVCSGDDQTSRSRRDFPVCWRLFLAARPLLYINTYFTLFVFSSVDLSKYSATWTPSQKPRLPPTQTFTLSTSNVADGCVASRACNTPATSQAHPSQPRSDGVGCSIIPPPTRAPWAKKE